MAKRTNLDLTEGPIFGKLLQFAVPLMVTSVVDSLYSTADTVMMGRFAGTNAMAAVGASAPVLGLLVNLFAGTAVGANVCCGNLLGARRKKDVPGAMYSGLLIGLFAGILVAVLGILLCRPILVAMDTPEEILENAVLYLSIRMAGGPVWLLAAFAAQLLYAHGNTRLSTVTHICSGLVNVGLNVVFVPVMGMGVEGVALATVASQVINAAVYLLVLFNPKGNYRLSLKELRLHPRHVRTILSVGLPNGMSSVVFSLSNVLLQSAVNSFGPLIIAGNTAADNINAYVGVVLNAFNSAALTAVSQNYGAHNFKRIDKVVVTASTGCSLMIMALAAVLTFVGIPLLMLFDSDPAVAQAGFPKLMFTCWGYAIHAVSTTLAAGLKGIRKATPALLCNACGVIVPRLLWVWFVIPLMHTTTMLYMIYPISYSINVAVMFFAYRHFRRQLNEKTVAL